MNIEPGFSREALDTAVPAEDEAALARKRKIIMAVAVAILVALLAYLALRGGNEPAAAPVQPPRVTVLVPGATDVMRTINATGTLAARREMPVGVAGEGGSIARVHVDAGDWVRAGQTLATIDSSVQTQEAAQLRARIAAARADAALAEAELKRVEALVSRGFVSRADVERRIATRDSARAQVAVAQAQLNEVNARIRRLAIRAPDAGLVLTRNVEAGQVVGPSNGALFTIAKDGEMELRAKLVEDDLAQLEVGDSAEVRPVGSAKSFSGRVWQIAPVISAATRQGEARVVLSYNAALRPGGFASAELHTGKSRAPLLPESAVQSGEQGNFVYIVGSDNKVVKRNVTIGDVTAKGLPILSGLTGKEQVVLSAGAFLNPGDEVIPVRDQQTK
ncbi:MAG: efflux RND transporter periplasmic adaptor subunit [Sphingomonadaceae bacterium]